jgi:hypothetical protein
MVPEVMKLCKLYLVNPATTATAERSLSRLRRLKTHLRTSLSQKKLNHLLILSTYPEEVDKLETSAILNEFIQRGDSKRRNAFAILE